MLVNSLRGTTVYIITYQLEATWLSVINSFMSACKTVKKCRALNWVCIWNLRWLQNVELDRKGLKPNKQWLGSISSRYYSFIFVVRNAISTQSRVFDMTSTWDCTEETNNLMPNVNTIWELIIIRGGLGFPFLPAVNLQGSSYTCVQLI